MTIKQISTLNYILGRLEGFAEGLTPEQQTYLIDTCELLIGVLEEEKTDE